MQFSPSQWCTIILATAVLHKMCIVDNTSLPENVGFFVGDDDHEEVYHKTGRYKRQVTGHRSQVTARRSQVSKKKNLAIT